VASWHDLIADSTVADAILDRIKRPSHHSPGREYAKAKKRTPLDGPKTAESISPNGNQAAEDPTSSNCPDFSETTVRDLAE
jgi:hypothetical protein